MIQVHQVRALIEQPQHDRLAVLRGHRRDAHVDHFVGDFDREPPVLRDTFLGDVQTAHELQARDQRTGDAPSVDDLFLKGAVYTLTDAQNTFARLDVDIRCAHLDRVLKHGLNQADHRCVR